MNQAAKAMPVKEEPGKPHRKLEAGAQKEEIMNDNNVINHRSGETEDITIADLVLNKKTNQN